MEISFLDVLQAWAGCEYLSDLRFMDGTKKRRLCKKLFAIRPEAVPLAEWNDALEYLTGDSHAGYTVEKAKDALINSLSNAKGNG